MTISELQLWAESGESAAGLMPLFQLTSTPHSCSSLGLTCCNHRLLPAAICLLLLILATVKPLKMSELETELQIMQFNPSFNRENGDSGE